MTAPHPPSFLQVAYVFGYLFSFLPELPLMREIMVPYVMKIPPSLLTQVEEACKTAKDDRRSWVRGITPAAYIRRAIERDLAHRARSRDRGGITSKPASK